MASTLNWLLIVLMVTESSATAGAPAGPSARDHLMKVGSPRQRCELQFLEAMGWQLSEGPGYSVNAGTPCVRDGLRSAIQAGDLKLQIATGPSESEEQRFLQTLDQLVQDPGTLCAFQTRLGEASLAAARKLTLNPKYQFSSGDEVCHLPAPEWKVAGLSCVMPAISSSKAIECVYDKECRTECLFGRYIEDEAYLYELYGPGDFDEAYLPADLRIGDNAPPFTLDKENLMNDKEFVALAHQGPQAFMGVNGYIGNVKGKDYLDAPVDQGENFVIVGISQSATDTAVGRGLSGTNQLSLKIWETSRALTPHSRDLLDDPDPTHLPEDSQQKAAILAVRELLSDPFLQNTFVYVHPLGIMRLAKHLARLLKINPRTPYEFDFGRSPAPALFKKYSDFKIGKCVEAARPGQAESR